MALESTVIAHGLPRPQNLETAQRLERIVRDEGATPATIAVLDGNLCVGLNQQQIEQVFRGLKDGDWLGWGPMYHWTDSKIRVHAFYCMLGISMLKYIHKQAQAAWPGLSMENLLDELRQIQLRHPDRALVDLRRGDIQLGQVEPIREIRSRQLN